MEDCLLLKLFKEFLGKADKENCPFFVDLNWTNNGESIRIKDCSIKRLSFQILFDVNNRLMGIQESSEEQRNKSDVILKAMRSFLDNGVLIEVNNAKQIQAETREQERRIPEKTADI
jgi:hypothetical protein